MAKKICIIHDFYVCTNTQSSWDISPTCLSRILTLKTYIIFPNDFHARYTDILLKRDNCLYQLFNDVSNYDKFIILKFSVITYGVLPYHPFSVAVFISYHSLTLIVQLVLDCHTHVKFSNGHVPHLIICLLGCDDEEPTPSLCLRSMVALIEYAMCGCLIYPIVSTYRVHK